MKEFLLIREWIFVWLCVGLLSACKGYDTTATVSIEDRHGRVNAGITIRPAPNDK